MARGEERDANLLLSHVPFFLSLHRLVSLSISQCSFSILTSPNFLPWWSSRLLSTRSQLHCDSCGLLLRSDSLNLFLVGGFLSPPSLLYSIAPISFLPFMFQNYNLCFTPFPFCFSLSIVPLHKGASHHLTAGIGNPSIIRLILVSSGNARSKPMCCYLPFPVMPSWPKMYPLFDFFYPPPLRVHLMSGRSTF